MNEFAPTSPNLPANSGIVSTEKQFSDSLTQDLTDEEIKQALALLLPIKKKWETKFMSKFSSDGNFSIDEAMDLVSEMTDEVSYTLAVEANILATVDVTPLLEGRPMVIEYMGVIPGHNLSRYGMDHEKKMFEAKKAKDRDEAYLGQKGTTDSAKAKNRDRRS